MRPKVWTTRRRLMGNLVPLALSLPFAAIGAWRIVESGETFGTGLLWLAAMPIVGWFAVNAFGLYANQAMRDESRKRLAQSGEPLGDRRTFVGFARPGRAGLLDAHEDVGFLIEHPEHVEFVGETHRVKLPRTAVVRIRYRPNPHTWIGLGRWVSIEGRLDDRPVRLLVEPREGPTMLSNRGHSKRLRAELEEWLKKEGPGA